LNGRPGPQDRINHRPLRGTSCPGRSTTTGWSRSTKPVRAPSTGRPSPTSAAWSRSPMPCPRTIPIRSIPRRPSVTPCRARSRSPCRSSTSAARWSRPWWTSRSRRAITA
jgi:hypothetical protein